MTALGVTLCPNAKVWDCSTIQFCKLITIIAKILFRPTLNHDLHYTCYFMVFQWLRSRINLLRSDILLLIIKITIVRQTINFKLFGAQKPFQFRLKTFFGFRVNSDTKIALILNEFPEKVRTRQNFCAQRPQKIRGNIAAELSFWGVDKLFLFDVLLLLFSFYFFILSSVFTHAWRSSYVIEFTN